MRKINQLLRKNKRELERSLNQLQPLKKKTEGLVKKAAKSGDYKSAKIYARELVNINKQQKKLHLSKTRLESITMSVNEQWQMKKLTQSILVSTGVMKDVNLLTNLGMMTGTFQELSKELMKAGIINEMMDDMVDLDPIDDDLETESQEEVNKIIESLTQEKFDKIDHEVPIISEPEEKITSPIEEDDTAMLDDMRHRLKALQE